MYHVVSFLLFYLIKQCWLQLSKLIQWVATCNLKSLGMIVKYIGSVLPTEIQILSLLCKGCMTLSSLLTWNINFFICKMGEVINILSGFKDNVK